MKVFLLTGKIWFIWGWNTQRVSGKVFPWGVDMDVYQHLSVDKFGPGAGEVGKSGSATSFSAGIYFRINPSFLIKQF